MNKATFVIAGASLAGAKAAEELRAQGFDGRILLVGAEPERPYERPPLTKDYLRGQTERAKGYVHPEDFYAQQEIELVTGVAVTAIDGYCTGERVPGPVPARSGPPMAPDEPQPPHEQARSSTTGVPIWGGAIPEPMSPRIHVEGGPSCALPSRPGMASVSPGEVEGGWWGAGWVGRGGGRGVYDDVALWRGCLGCWACGCGGFDAAVRAVWRGGGGQSPVLR